jgi:hypothetical protein
MTLSNFFSIEIMLYSSNNNIVSYLVFNSIFSLLQLFFQYNYDTFYINNISVFAIIIFFYYLDINI